MLSLKKEDSFLDELIERYPVLTSCRNEIWSVYEIVKSAFLNGNKLLICGNGGSSADSQHIVGELLKSFGIERHILPSDREKLESLYGKDGIEMAMKIERGLPAISLDSIPIISSAFANDVGAEYVYAQILYNYGERGDVLLTISTSGNSKNVINAAKLSKIMGIKVVGLTGENGGELNKLCDELIHAPGNKTFLVQDYHVPIYHTLCLMLENYFFYGNETEEECLQIG